MFTFAPARPGLVTFTLAGLDPLARLAARDAIGLWDVATGASFAEVPQGARLSFRAGEDFPAMVAAVGRALGVPAAPGFALQPGDVAGAQALWGTPQQEQEIGFVWRWDAALDALRLDATVPQGRLLPGTDGRDALFGGTGDDWVEGGAGDDLLSGGGGMDSLRGGAGFDAALVPFLRAEAPADFRWARLSTPTGDLTLDGVERLDLRDGDWILDPTHAAARLEALYRALLDRPADGAGLTAGVAAMEAGMSLSAVAATMLASDEYRLRFGAPSAEDVALAAEADARIAAGPAPVWVPDAEAALAVRFFHFGAGRLPGREELLRWTDALEREPDEEVAARFLAEHGAAGDAAGFLAFVNGYPALAATDALTRDGARFGLSTGADVIM